MHFVKHLSSLLIPAINLGIADLTMSLYHCMIISVNYIYNGYATYVATTWKESVMCRLIGVTMMFSMIASNLFTGLIAIDRYVVTVIHPFKRYGLSRYRALIGVVICYLCALVLSIMTGLYSNTSIKNTMCIFVGSSVSFGISVLHIIINISIFSCMIIACTGIIFKIMKSEKAKIKFEYIIIRLGLILLTHLISSLTLTLIAILFLLHVDVPYSVEAMVALALIPFNACFNPLINTITSRRFLSSYKLISLK